MYFTVSVLTLIRVISEISSHKNALILYAAGGSLRGLFL